MAAHICDPHTEEVEADVSEIKTCLGYMRSCLKNKTQTSTKSTLPAGFSCYFQVLAFSFVFSNEIK